MLHPTNPFPFSLVLCSIHAIFTTPAIPNFIHAFHVLNHTILSPMQWFLSTWLFIAITWGAFEAASGRVHPPEILI
jgi:hypothetical protein